MDLRTLQFWHKLEHFYPYILQEQRSPYIQTFRTGGPKIFPDFEAPLVCENREVRGYCVYLGIFQVAPALAALEEGIGKKMRFRDCGKDESCFCMFRLSPWAIHRVRAGKICLDHWDEDFFCFQKEAISYLETRKTPVDYDFLQEFRDMLASQMNWTVAYCRDWLRIDMMTGRTLKDGSSATPGADPAGEEIQAENYRKMFLAMAKDIRVILIKLADRLHNMRTLNYMTEAKQQEKAQETLDIYAPLAHRLGISKIRTEMEDLCFKYLNPDAYYDLKSKIEKKKSEREQYVNRIVKEIDAKVKESGIKGTVYGRSKHFFSIYKKMVNQNKTLDQIYDLFAVRIIVDTVKDCYAVLGIVHDMYKPMPGRFKDYIAMPKTNMYQSLHNTLIGPTGEPFEVQIRTWEMHRTSEYGIAAHWKYKEGRGGEVTQNKEEEKLAWLRQILEWQRDLSDNKEFMTTLKSDLNIFNDSVYAFTPQGKVIPLPNGSTPIDFAYSIHSAVGNKMVGARVNNKIVTFDYKIQNGDIVEIITSQNSRGPSRDWLSLVKSSTARTKINQWFKKEFKEENIVKGKELIIADCKKKNYFIVHISIIGHENYVYKKKYTKKIPDITKCIINWCSSSSNYN